MIRVVLKGLAGRPVRTALTTLAIVVGVAFVCAAYTLTDTMRNAANDLSAAAYDGTDAVVVAKTAFTGSQTADVRAQAPAIPAAALARVRRAPGVTLAAGDITDTAEIVGRDGKVAAGGPYFGVGLDPRAQRLTPFRLRAGRWAAGPGQVVIDQGTAEREGFRVGDTIRVSTRGAAQRFRLVGIASFASVKSLGRATAAIFDLGVAQKLFHKAGYDRILVAGHGNLRGALAAAAGPRAEVKPATADDRFTFDSLRTFVSIIRTILLAFAGVAVLVGAFTIFNSLSITVAQRTREFGLLRMAGASRRQVRRAVLLEALAIGLLASGAGIAAGLGIEAGLNALFSAVGLELPATGTVISARTIVASLAVGTLTTLLAAAIPARRATRIAPVAALRAADADAATPRGLSRAVRGLASVVGRPAERLGGSAGALARRNAMRHPGRTAVTAAALTIGVALVTAVTVVAKGLDDQSRGTLDQHIRAAAVVTGADGWSPIDPQVERAAAAAPGVRAVTSLRQDGALVYGKQEGVNAVDPATIGRLFGYDWKAGGPQALAHLGRDGAIVDDGFASRHHLTVGSRLDVTSMRGTTLHLTVRGIEDSPVLDVLSLGPITVSQAAFGSAFDNARNRLTLVDGPVAAVERALAPYPDAKVLSKAAFIDDQTAFIGQILAILWVLLALAVIVSLFGIVNTLVLATFERTRELGTLRAVGMSRRQVRRMVRHESVITAMIGATLGIAAGLALAGGLVAWLGSYGLSFAIPVPSLAAVAVVAALAGVVAAALPARRAARLDVLGALAYE